MDFAGRSPAAASLILRGMIAFLFVLAQASCGQAQTNFSADLKRHGFTSCVRDVDDEEKHVAGYNFTVSRTVFLHSIKEDTVIPPAPACRGTEVRARLRRAKASRGTPTLLRTPYGGNTLSRECTGVPGGTPPQNEDKFDNLSDSAQELLSHERWQELAQLLENVSNRSAELNYDYGLALAHLQRWDEARKVFLKGQREAPRDNRFPIELAGIAFKQKKHSESISYLRRALRLGPKDNYANEFLATVYFLDGNLEAALKYFNRVGKPMIEQVRIQSGLRVDPVLLDHAFAFSPASILHVDELLTSQARLRGLDIFPSYRLDLLALEDGRFNLQFGAQERHGWGNSTLEALLTTLRGLPYQEVTPEYFNIRGSATNFMSLFRWDAQKRRAEAALSGPWRRNPKWIYRLKIGGREENWEIRQSFTGPAPPLAGLNLQREELSAEITRLVGWRWQWSVGGQFSHRNYRDIFGSAVLDSNLLAAGNELTQTARLNYQLWRVPEKRFTIESDLSSQASRLLSTSKSNTTEFFEKLQAGIKSQWFPQLRGDDYATRWNVRAGNIFGQFPFDELFMLGVERDNDLWLRAHIGTRDGQKGSAPLGRRYFLSNWETDKNVYRNGLISVKLGPFLDTGKIGGAPAALSSPKWLWDTGIQCKVFVFGVGIGLSYGKDLRSGHNAFYTAVGR
jgi:tetratricopeptide (TPR) repeat protein